MSPNDGKKDRQNLRECSRCNELFFIESPKIQFVICPDCREKNIPQSSKTDCWQYLKKGIGYRLTKGFNLMSGKD